MHLSVRLQRSTEWATVAIAICCSAWTGTIEGPCRLGWLCVANMAAICRRSKLPVLCVNPSTKRARV